MQKKLKKLFGKKTDLHVSHDENDDDEQTEYLKWPWDAYISKK